MKTVQFLQGGMVFGRPVATDDTGWAPTKGTQKLLPDEIADDLIAAGLAEEVKEGAELAPSGPFEAQALPGAPETQARRRPRGQQQ